MLHILPAHLHHVKMVFGALTSGASLAFVSAWAGHTDRSRRDADAVNGALHALGWKRAYAADLMGISEKELIHQLSGVRPLNHWRLADLPDAFQQAYDACRAQQRGAVLFEREAIALIRGCLQVGRKRMLRVCPQLVHDEEQRKRA